MEDKRKIKEIYNCISITSNEELYPLQKWYNQLIEKTIAEITVADVLRMVRQKEFTNLAMSKAISFLQEDVFAGESYEGELLEKVSEMDSSFLAGDKVKNNAYQDAEIWWHSALSVLYSTMISSLLK